MVSRRNEVGSLMALVLDCVAVGIGIELGVSVQILTHSLSHSVAWIAGLIAPTRLQF